MNPLGPFGLMHASLRPGRGLALVPGLGESDDEESEGLEDEDDGDEHEEGLAELEIETGAHETRQTTTRRAPL